MSDTQLILVCDKVRAILGDERFKEVIQPLLERTEAEALALLLQDMKLSTELTKKSNQELGELLISEIWAKLPINSPAALLVSEVIDRLKHPFWKAIGGFLNDS